MKRPSVLFLLADDQQFDTIRALGNPAIHTPNLDRLVACGTAFRNAYILGGNVPACCPSRAMIHTGRSFFRIADVRNIGATLETMPETFRRAGYRTFATGKQHNGPAAVARGFGEAEALLFAGMGHHMRLEVQDFDSTGQYAPERRQERRQYSSEMFTEAALRFLDSPGEAPFFLYCAFTAPHDPMMVPATYRALYDPQRVPFPASFLPRHPFDFSPRGDRVRPFQSCDECTADAVVRFHHWPIEEGDLRELRALYYATITHLDAQIGRLLDKLEQCGELDHTIIVFAADNGIAMGQHGCYHKQSCYDHDVHVPLLVSGPGIPAGHDRGDLVYLHDLYPTLGELAGVNPPVRRRRPQSADQPRPRGALSRVHGNLARRPRRAFQVARLRPRNHAAHRVVRPAPRPAGIARSGRRSRPRRHVDPLALRDAPAARGVRRHWGILATLRRFRGHTAARATVSRNAADKRSK